MTLTTVAVLAGGSSSRMGADKAGVVIAGRTMLDHVTTAVTASGLPMLVVGPGGHVADVRSPSSGPMAGVEAALLATGGDVVAVAVDQPWLRAGTIAALAAAEGDAVVPVAAGRLQVTCARYARDCLAVFSAALDAGERSLQRALLDVEVTGVDEAAWRTWGEDGRSWYSVDTPQAAAAGLRAFGPPGTLPA